MIIKASRIATSSGAGAVASHVLRGPKNEKIELLQGSGAQLRDAMRDAQAGGSKYGLRHYKISPGEAATPDDLKQIAADLGREFGFNPDGATLVMHQKPRAGGAGFDKHAHLLVPEYDPVKNRVLDWHQSYARHEKIARVAEQRLGHAFVPGRHNAAVSHTLTAEGNQELAAAVGELVQRPRPNSAYTTDQHQRAQRSGRNQPNDRLAVRQAWERSDSPAAFAAALAEQGIGIRTGDKAGTWIAERDGQLIGAVHRLAKADKGEVARRLEGADLRAVPHGQPPVPEPPPLPAQPATRSAEPMVSTTTPEHTAATPSSLSTAAQPAAAAAEPANLQSAPSRDGTAAEPVAQSGGGGGGGGGIAVAASGPPAVLHEDGGGGDPTAGIEIPRPGDLLGEIRYREAVAKRAAQKAEAAARRGSPSPPQQTSSGGNHAGHVETGDNGKAAAEAVRRFVADLETGLRRGRAETAIREAVRRFNADCAAIGRDDPAERSDNKAAGRDDNRDAPEHRRSPELVGGPDEPAAVRGAESDNGNPELSGGAAGKSGAHRAAARAHIEDASTSARFRAGLKAHPEAMQRLQEAACRLQPDPFGHFDERGRFQALNNARTDLFALYQTEQNAAAEAEKARWKSTLDQHRTASEKLAGTVRTDGRSGSKTSKTAAYSSVKPSRERTIEMLKKTAPERPTFEKWLRRQGRTDPSAREVARFTVEQRQRREASAARITADRETIARVLRTHPHPDPRDLDPRARADKYAGRLSDGLRDRQAAAEAAEQAAAHAAAQRSTGTKILTAIGITTPEQRRVDELRHHAYEAAETARRRRPTSEDYKRARSDGAAHAYAAVADVAAWKERPDVAAALEHHRLNGLVKAAVDAGDRQISAALNQGDPAAARATIRAREEHEKQKQRLLVAARSAGRRGPKDPGDGGPVEPRMR